MRHPEGGSNPSLPETQGGRSLGDALAWLGRHINLEAIERGVAGRLAHPDLSRIRVLLAAMGDPQAVAPIVHVTGTNGKGSTTRMVAALLSAQGLQVGTFTSPHLERLNERIAVAGEPISDRALAGILAALEELESFLLQRGPGAGGLPDAPTWFELMTAAGFRHFADIAVEAAVVEVGLGGRYDATNAADAAVAVVTNVELDHVDILGPTRHHIAREKAGIIKAGTVAVIGEDDAEIAQIFTEEAEAVGASALWRRGLHFGVEANELAHGGRMLDLRTPGALYRDVYLSLHGAHQAENASVALAAAEAFFGGPIEESVVAEAFGQIQVPGRLEVMARHPLVVLDGGHNVAGAEALGMALAEDFSGARNVIVIMGCLRGRDPGALLRAVADERCRLVVACSPLSPRALEAGVVADAARELGLPVEVAGDIPAALETAMRVASSDDLIVVTGSLYVVGEARVLLRRAS